MFVVVLLLSQKMETQIFINQWMDKQNVVYLHSKILFSHKKEQSTDICHMNAENIVLSESQTQKFTCYDSIYMKYSE